MRVWEGVPVQLEPIHSMLYSVPHGYALNNSDRSTILTQIRHDDLAVGVPAAWRFSVEHGMTLPPTEAIRAHTEGTVGCRGKLQQYKPASHLNAPHSCAFNTVSKHHV